MKQDREHVIVTEQLGQDGVAGIIHDVSQMLVLQIRLQLNQFLVDLGMYEIKQELILVTEMERLGMDGVLTIDHHVK